MLLFQRMHETMIESSLRTSQVHRSTILSSVLLSLKMLHSLQPEKSVDTRTAYAAYVRMFYMRALTLIL
jgi:hypothetical protein